ncbi:ATP-grasp domain-containing protein [Halobaculum gomorrense]|uniref:Ribosomal protein S6--L-glutamate ligase n=1 Tax=Halobaculum gomorrense TaxID=43928 RepID=A0A1M5K3X8_9EURY|nr:ATP-grasp domain-containing protein [Halobaculum gomorrense]SHG46983.1 ribosomal protein S6--L-glutamate ligase [Halobaculum gomorrense]
MTTALPDPDLRLAVTTRAETFERLRDRLAPHGIAVEHVRPDERVLRVAAGGADESVADGAEADEFAGFDAGWVYPSRLMEGAVIDARLDVPWVNGREAVLASRNKAGTLATLADAGLPVPETRLVSNPVDDEAVLAAADEIGYPVVVKPNSATRGVGVAKATDPDSLLGVTDYLDLVHDYRATGDKSYLLQAFLPDATDYRAMVLDGTYAGAVERRLPEAALAEGKWKHNVHRGAVAEGVDLPAEARGLAERAAAALDAPLLGVDLLESDGRIVVSETNARPTIDAAKKYREGFDADLAALVRRTADR